MCFLSANSGIENIIKKTTFNTAFCQKPERSEYAVSGINQAKTEPVIVFQPMPRFSRNVQNSTYRIADPHPTMTAPNTACTSLMYETAAGVFCPSCSTFA